jgi:hypothetical protein
MRLYFLAPLSRSSININRLRDYSFNIRDKIVMDTESIGHLVVLGNGSPEDEVVGIVAWHQTNDCIVGVIKPNRHYTDAYRELKGYLGIKSPRNFIFVTDQDSSNLNDLFKTIEGIIQEQGIVINAVTPNPHNRVKIFECSLAGVEFRVISVVSGLDNFVTPAHEIEDHLLVTAGFTQANNSKDDWAALPRDQKTQIMSSLKDRNIAARAFQQHFVAFSFLQ